VSAVYLQVLQRMGNVLERQADKTDPCFEMMEAYEK
jgi:hypothetical protein